MFNQGSFLAAEPPEHPKSLQGESRSFHLRSEICGREAIFCRSPIVLDQIDSRSVVLI